MSTRDRQRGAAVGLGGAGRVGEQVDRRARLLGGDVLVGLPDADDDRGARVDHAPTLPVAATRSPASSAALSTGHAGSPGAALSRQIER